MKLLGGLLAKSPQMGGLHLIEVEYSEPEGGFNEITQRSKACGTKASVTG